MFDQAKEYLKEIVYLNKRVYIAIGYQKLTVDGTIAALTVPSNARYAELKLESVDANVAARFLLLGSTGTQPSSTDGIGLGNLDVIDISGTENLNNFRIIRAQSGVTTLHVQYYK